MGILDFTTAPTAAQAATAAAQGAAPKKKEGEYFLNFGYPINTVSDDGEEVSTFVSLATVTTVDTAQDFDLTRINSPFMRNLRDAQNGLKHDLMEVAVGLEPGEAIIIMTDERTGLCVELRRRKAPNAAPVTGENPMRRKVSFGSKPSSVNATE